MADTRPTAVSFLGAIKLCLFAMFAPTKLDIEERLDNEAWAHFSGNDSERSKAKLVTSAFWSALCLVLFFGGVGYICSLVLRQLQFCAWSTTVIGLQMLGALLLLWGTLFIRGWDIQTFAGVTLTERVNRWIYRGQYCVGTALIVFSLAAPQCAR